MTSHIVTNSSLLPKTWARGWNHLYAWEGWTDVQTIARQIDRASRDSCVATVTVSRSKPFLSFSENDGDARPPIKIFKGRATYCFSANADHSGFIYINFIIRSVVYKKTF
ncbi:hypothetical protein TNCT_442171 [Trichonephila clavata]|uniref:Uncharacterized protein n=1 Tax=Trichonephila clavata TaxID=2740835 RepID=A0A8X6HK27_TRICU|nr:hypothetical protein TNCT_442171 [Trichonephila clavata]